MTPYFFSRRMVMLFATLLIILCAFTALEVRQQYWRQNADNLEADAAPTTIPTLQDAEASLMLQSEASTLDDTQKRHLALLEGRLCVYAGPLGGGGAILHQLDIPLQSIPARWLMQLTNGGIEFPNEETLLMALDNLDELTEDNLEALSLTQY